MAGTDLYTAAHHPQLRLCHSSDGASVGWQRFALVLVVIDDPSHPLFIPPDGSVAGYG